jgi:hypothetical protein
VLTPEDIVKAAPASTAFISSVGPESTTVKMAGEPLATPSGGPGAFPETPAADLNKEFKVSPLPAAPGGVNPVKLAPGEKVPETGEDINSHVKLDAESYEKADTLPGGASAAFVSSVAPGATTVGLAGGAPLETKVPEVVKESQEKAGVEPEASADPAEVKEKSAVEAELLQKVPEAASTSEGTSGKGTEKSEAQKPITETVVATAAGLGATAVAAAVATKDKAVEQANILIPQAQAAATNAAANLPEPVKQALPVSAQEAISNTTKEEARQEVSPEVPAEVKESIKEAGKSPEAAGNTEAVQEKKAVEAELLKEVKPVPAEGEASTTTNGTESKATKAKEEAKAVKDEAVEAVKKPVEATTSDGATASKEPEASASTPTKEKKKKNRMSGFFGKLSAKLSSKDKDKTTKA